MKFYPLDEGYYTIRKSELLRNEVILLRIIEKSEKVG